MSFQSATSPTLGDAIARIAPSEFRADAYFVAWVYESGSDAGELAFDFRGQPSELRAFAQGILDSLDQTEREFEEGELPMRPTAQPLRAAAPGEPIDLEAAAFIEAGALLKRIASLSA